MAGSKPARAVVALLPRKVEGAGKKSTFACSKEQAGDGGPGGPAQRVDVADRGDDRGQPVGVGQQAPRGWRFPTTRRSARWCTTRR
jgi:hypothetical protein